MRLTKAEILAIKETVLQRDEGAKIYLFGSRVDDAKRGGDIDLLVLSSKITFREKLEIKLDMYDRMGEQKIDLLIEQDESKPFTRIALEEGVLL